ncbi:MAG: Wzz/FepE/Etk N-terminal domain-containing protein [Pseudomonadota bacterium]
MNTTNTNTNTNNKYETNDETNLADLALKFHKYRKQALTTLILTTLIGLLIAFIAPKKYTYSTLIEIGGKTSLGNEKINFSTIESPQSSKIKIETAYVPLVYDELKTKKNEKNPPIITTTIPKDTNSILLQSKATVTDAETTKQMHQQVVELLAQNHATLLTPEVNSLTRAVSDSERKLQNLSDATYQKAKTEEIESRIESAQSNLAKLEEDGKGIGELIKKQENSEETTRIEIENTKKLLDKLTNGQNNNKSAVNPERQITIDSQTISLQERLSDLEIKLQQLRGEKKLELEIKLRENTLSKQKAKSDITQLEYNLTLVKADLARDLSAQQEALDIAKSNLNNLRKTRAITIAEQSIAPSSPGKLKIIMLSLFIGILFSFIIVYFLDLKANITAKYETTKT